MTSRMGMSAASAVAMHTAVSGKSRFMMLLTLDMPCAAVSFRISLAHDFNNDAFGPLPVEFRVINLLPRSEIEFSRCHRHDYLVMHQQALQVRVTIALARPMMPIVLAKRSQAFQPFIDVRQQSVFGIV